MPGELGLGCNTADSLLPLCSLEQKMMNINAPGCGGIWIAADSKSGHKVEDF